MPEQAAREPLAAPARQPHALARWWSRRSLQTKASLMVTGLVALALASAALLLRTESARILEGEALRQAHTTAGLGARVAEGYLTNARYHLTELVQDPALQAAVRAGDVPAIQAELRRTESDPGAGFDHLVWVAPDGQRLASSASAGTSDPAWLNREWFQAALSRPRDYLGQPLQTTETRQVVVPLAQAVRDTNGTGLGVVAGRLDVSRLADGLIATTARPSQRLLVIDTRTGTVAGASDPRDLQRPPDFLAAIAARAPNDEPEAQVLQRGNGPRLLVARAPVAGTAWVVVVVEAADDALGALATLLQRGRLMVLGILAVAALLSWWMGRQFVRPLAELRAAATRVAHGDLSGTVPVRSDDELGQVAASFNTMRQALTDALAASAAAEQAARAAAAREALFNRINARVRASLEVDSVVATTTAEVGVALGASRCALYLLRDGELQPCRQAWTGRGMSPGEATLAPGAYLQQVVSTGQPLVQSAGAAPPATDGAVPTGDRDGRSGALLAVPLQVGAAILGVLAVEAIGAPRAWTADEVALVESVAGEAAVALTNARLYAEVLDGQRRLAGLIAGIGEGVLVVDPGGRVTLWNAAAERLLGRPAAAAIGQPWQALLTGRDAAGEAVAAPGSALARALAGGAAVSELDLQLDGAAEDGPWLGLSLAPLELPDGRHWIVACRDVSTYKAVEQLKADFVATVSHELRTPLASIKGYAATLLQHHRRLPAATQAEYLQIVNQEADRLNAMVTELLDVARLERGQTRVECVPTALAPLSERVAELARMRAEDQRITVAVPAAVQVEAAPDRLAQVLTNLVDNAVKYSRAGGAVRISAEQHAGTVVLAVSDEGVGIPLDRQAELFHPFVRVENVLTRQTEGAGLGLYISRQLVERMGGHIELTSAPGVGTTVTVTLRAAAQASANKTA